VNLELQVNLEIQVNLELQVNLEPYVNLEPQVNLELQVNLNLHEWHVRFITALNHFLLTENWLFLIACVFINCWLMEQTKRRNFKVLKIKI